jgi:heme exporter protein A
VNTDALISIENLSKFYGNRPALRQFNAEIGRGETIALVGANGSGKTTLLRILAGLSRPTTGQVRIGGWLLPQETAMVRAQIGFLSYAAIAYDDLSAHENLAFFAKLYGLSEAGPRISDLLQRVGLAKRAHDKASTFSRGMLQRLGLARAILHQPALLLLDEPYTGLDLEGAKLLDSVVAEWAAAGRTTILALHDLAHAAQVASRALVLKAGRLTAVAEGANLNADGLAAALIG